MKLVIWSATLFVLVAITVVLCGKIIDVAQTTNAVIINSIAR